MTNETMTDDQFNQMIELLESIDNNLSELLGEMADLAQAINEMGGYEDEN